MAPFLPGIILGMNEMIEAVELPKAYRLLNHGPTVLVSSAHGGRRNIMAAAWNSGLDFTPAKVLVVIDKSTWTRELVEASGEFALNIPCRAQAQATLDIGSGSGRAMVPDKFARLGLTTFSSTKIGAPLLEGCVAWLECRVIPEPQVEKAHDLFIGEVVAAWADSRVFSNGHWHFGEDPSLRTIHYIAGGTFLAIGEEFEAVKRAVLSAPDLAGDHAAARYVKDEMVDVVFAAAAGALQSREGINRYRAGDALITGSTGDRWSVSRERFDAKYDAVPPAMAGNDGRYRARPVPVWAKQMAAPFTIARRAGGDVLEGNVRDWLMQYAPGDYGVVEDVRFRRVYRPL